MNNTTKFERTPKTIHYRLYSILTARGKRYCIRAVYQGEHKTCTLTCNDAERARAIFAKICNGKVTPCTLADVIEDLS